MEIENKFPAIVDFPAAFAVFTIPHGTITTTFWNGSNHVSGKNPRS